MQRQMLDTGQQVAVVSSAAATQMVNSGAQAQPILSPATFLEPPQYLTAISVQPVLAAPAGFSAGSAAVLSPIQVRILNPPYETLIQIYLTPL